MVAALFPWIPGLALLGERALYSDSRRKFLLLWAVFGFLFFSAAQNKLPSYVLPVVPPLAVLMGIALADRKRARWLLVATAALLVFLGPIAAMLPEALAAGISRSTLPAFQWMWLLPALACARGVGSRRHGESRRRHSASQPPPSPQAQSPSNSARFPKWIALPPRALCGTPSRPSANAFASRNCTAAFATV